MSLKTPENTQFSITSASWWGTAGRRECCRNTQYIVFRLQSLTQYIDSQIPKSIIFPSKSGKISGKLLSADNEAHLPLKLGKGFLFLLSCQVGIDIQCRSNVRVSHNFLNDLECIRIGCVLAHPRAECMPQVMNGKMGQQQRFSSFIIGSLCLTPVIVRDDSGDTAIDAMRRIHPAEAVGKNEV